MDEELDTKFGAKQAIAADPLEKLVDARMSRPEPQRPPEDDPKMDPCEWVKSHFNRIAQKDVQARVWQDEWRQNIIHVEVRGRPGSISVEHIDELRRTRNLDAITKAMRAWLSG
ncbi:MAG TPA: hypothetical protein VFU34_05050, partial [Gaiellaceae bacterium]|nr:hypothetical protein [Gaiellaceae bacterium]